MTPIMTPMAPMVPMTDEVDMGSDDVPDIGLRFTDSDMDYARDSSAPSHDDSIDAYKRSFIINQQDLTSNKLQ